jgi:hypothetical protein
MNQIDRVRIERGAYLLHRLGPIATAELLADVADRIGGLQCIFGCLADFEERRRIAVRKRTARTVPVAHPEKVAAR